MAEVQAGKGDLRKLANGLIPSGFDAAKLTPEGRDEVRAAIDVILKLNDQRFARLSLALEQLDRAADEIDRLRAALEQIATVCADNASDTCNHRMALDFVSQVARKATGA